MRGSLFVVLNIVVVVVVLMLGVGVVVVDLDVVFGDFGGFGVLGV